MTDYYLMYGGEIDRKHKYTGIENARKKAVKEIKSGMNVNAIVPVGNGRYQYIWTVKMSQGWHITVEYWSGSKGRYTKSVLNDDGTITKSKW